MKFKEEAIQRWKNACCNPINLERIKIAVGAQWQRKEWELPDEKGLIRIDNLGQEPRIIVYKTHGYIESNSYTKQKMYERTLSVEEYKELENLFFRDYTQDNYYLEKIAEIMDEYRNHKIRV